jgi:hydroxymethylpyrimidine/phosphomethylpyrimidine kinase
MTKTLLTLAGFDPSGGAGVLLDIAVFRRLGCRGMGVLTAVTAQNTQGVKEFLCLPLRFILSQYTALTREVSFAGIKVGMMGCRKNLRILGRILSDSKNIPTVVDPVFRSSSGAWLLERAALPSYVSQVRGRISLLTPNLAEAALISGQRVRNLEQMKEAARKISDLIESSCLITGGHLEKKVVDVLFDGKRFHLFEKKKINKDVHGTGCFFSSSLLGYLAKGHPLVKACALASDLTDKAIKGAVYIGKGRHALRLFSA